MSGRKQHFIPQLLQRGFGVTKAKKAQVYVFKKGVAPYLSATGDVAAQRDFYSAPSDEKTLDDRITDYEGAVLAPAIAALREVPLGAVDSNLAAGVVVHLSIRAAFVRGTFSDAASSILDHFAEALGSQDATRSLLKIDTLEPDSVLMKTLEEELSAHLGEVPENGRAAVVKLIHFRAREKFQQMFPSLAGMALEQFELLLERMPELIESGHTRALARDLVPPQRVERLKAMSWRIISADAPLHFLLPDCLAVGFKSERMQDPAPYYLVDDDELKCVVMPVCSSRVLVGCSDAPELNSTELNRAFAQCSYEFFISSRDDPETMSHAAHIGKCVERFIEELVDDQRFSPPESEGKADRQVAAAYSVRFDPSARKSGKAQAILRRLLSSPELQEGLRVVKTVTVCDDVAGTLRRHGTSLNGYGEQTVKLGTCQVLEAGDGLSCHLFVPADLVKAAMKENELTRAAASLIRHQAGRAVYAAHTSRLPAEVRKRLRPLLETVTLGIAQFFASQYFGNRLSELGELTDAEFAAADELFVRVIEAAGAELERARLHFFEHRNSDAASTHALMHIEMLLCAAASACATDAGRPARWLGTRSLAALRAVGLEEWFELFARDLDQYFLARGHWSGDSELVLLAGHVERVSWSYGFVWSTKVPEQVWMDVQTEEQIAQTRAMLKL